MPAAVAAPSRLPRRNADAFASVFPLPSFTTPTPEATPKIGTLASPAHSFGPAGLGETAADETVRLSRAWSAATRFLAIPPAPAVADDQLRQEDVQSLLLLLNSPASQQELLAWYSNEISLHFRSFVLPELQSWHHPVLVSRALALVLETIAVMRKVQSHYFARLNALNSTGLHVLAQEQVARFVACMRQHLRVLIVHSLPTRRVEKTLTTVMYMHMQASLAETAQSSPPCLEDGVCRCTISPDGFPFPELYEIGLGGSVGQQAFAHAVHQFLNGPAIERRCFEVDWAGRESVMTKLRTWIKDCFNPFAEHALGRLNGDPSFTLSPQDVKQFDVMAAANIGRLRTSSLFDYVKTWPDSAGAVLDVKSYINIKELVGAGGLSEKAYVCESFSSQIQRRLLHAGATTSEILGIYINVIHAFKTLDARGVLLGKVGTQIRNYLRTRDDTVSIIAASLLVGIDQYGNVAAADDGRICPDITLEIANSTADDARDNKSLNWNDLHWVPDPIDAGPDYKSSKFEDVASHILGLFEQEELIKEVTALLAQHLLHSADSEYVNETRLVELLKARLDATKLQAAEVMLRDMRDSVSLGKRITPTPPIGLGDSGTPTPREILTAIPANGITLGSLYTAFEKRISRAEFLAVVKLISHRRNDLLFPKNTRLPPGSPRLDTTTSSGQTDFKAQIVSSFFWPQLRDNAFRMPSKLEPLSSHFEDRFNAMGSQRKLQFRPALARVSLRLDLEDRTVEESDLPGWRASVIDAFTGSAADSESAHPTPPISLSAEDLTEKLQMEEELVQDALKYWTGKRILYQQATDGSYAVLERLDMDTGATDRQEQVQQQEISAVRSQDALLRESAPMFQAFIANMLRNGGPKEVGGMMGITNVLKMVNPAFTYGDEEVMWLLGEMEGRGEVVKAGELWAAESGENHK